jgi:hypothetical protein
MVELAAKDAQRLPTAGECVAEGIRLPRIAVAAGADPLPLVLAALATQTSASPKMAEK